MCDTNAFVSAGNGEELLLENVDLIRPEDNGTVYLRNLFGEEKVFKGRLKEISLKDHRVLLEP